MPDTEWIIAHIAVISLLVLSSGFLSGSETALTAASRTRILHRLERGDHRAKAVLELLERYDQLISVLLFCNNVVNILASALATSIFITFYGELGVALATLVMTVIILLFAEITPKTYAAVYPDDTALRVGRLWLRLLPLFLPVTLLTNKLVQGMFLLVGINVRPEHSPEHHIEELKGAISQHDSTENTDQAHESDMLRSILELDEIDISAVMTHRSEVMMLDLDQSSRSNLDAAIHAPYSRIPLYRGDAEDIVGVLHAKRLLSALRSTKDDDISMEKLAVPPWFIPENTRLLDQLQAFRNRREHFAVVVDEYGGLAGVVTLEDILEVIVGEIDDESDTLQPGIQLNEDGSYTVPGSTSLRTLNRELELNLPEDESYTTLAGLLLYRSKSIPDPGQSFLVDGLRIDVTGREGNQITRLMIYKDTPQ